MTCSGNSNSSCQLKMVIPNRCNAYLHGTPTRRPFESGNATLHPCGAVSAFRVFCAETGVSQQFSLDTPRLFLCPTYVIASHDGTVDFCPDV